MASKNDLILFYLCYEKEWDEVRKLLQYHPSLAWSARDERGGSLAIQLTSEKRMDLLLYIVELIQREPQEEQERLFRDAFERSDNDGWTAMHCAAVFDWVDGLKFLLRYCPSGLDILEITSSQEHNDVEPENSGSWSLAHCCTFNDNLETLEFILRTSKSGILMFNNKNSDDRTPLDIAGPSTRQYFTPQKIREVGLEREHDLTNIDMRSNSLLTLAFDILQQHTNVLLFHLRLQK